MGIARRQKRGKMSGSVAQLSTFEVLRPYRRFEADYDGKPGDLPISFTGPTNPTDPGFGNPDLFAFDSNGAQIPGVSPRLAKGLPVPLGSTVLLYLPIIPPGPYWDVATGPDPSIDDPPLYQYVWRIVFRLRNVADFQRIGAPYHVRKQSYGANDTRTFAASVDVGPERLIIPGCSEVAVFNHTELAAAKSNSNAPLGVPPNTERRSMMLMNSVLPESYSLCTKTPVIITPDGSSGTQGLIARWPLVPDRESGLAPGVNPTFCDWQQGVLDPNYTGTNYNRAWYTSPTFFPVWTKAVGDEMAVWLYKFEYDRLNPVYPNYPTPRAWSFSIGVDLSTNDVFPTSGSEDYGLSYLFGMGQDNGTSPTVPTPFTEMGVYVAYGKAGA